MSQYSYRTRRQYGGRPMGGNRNVSRNRRGPNKQTLPVSRFIKPAVLKEVEAYTPVHTFMDFEVHPILQQNIIKKGYTHPSAIQDQSIPYGLQGKDVVGLANTGTGKTAAFAIPLLNKLMNDKSAKALIIAPTRELAQQIEGECREFARGSGLFGALLIGGSPMHRQVRDLRDRPQIVIGTPGRIKDHMERGNLVLAHFNVVVLDEVDRMLDMGFISDIETILGQLKKERQSFFFSATMESKIEKLIRTFSADPVIVSAKRGETSDNVDQNIVRHSGSGNKMEKLHDVLLTEGVSKALIFEETKRDVDRLSKELVLRGFSADSIHGNKSQSQRKRALDRFRNNEITILVATDVAARGIDVADITHVINYSVPNTYDDYVHRIGRAGRAGRLGYALTFVND